MPPDRRKTLLIVDNDDEMRETLTAPLRRDYRVLRAATGEAALQMMEKEDVDLMLLDVHLPGISGFEVLKIVRENYPYVEVIVISKIERARRRRSRRCATARTTTSPRTSTSRASARSSPMPASDRISAATSCGSAPKSPSRTNASSSSARAAARARSSSWCRRSRSCSATVLMLGESGTGKELLARLIHRESGRPTAPFVAVNLAAIPKELVESTLFGHEKGAFTGAIRQQLGKFELAAGGTLFLDEVGDLRTSCRRSCCARSRKSEIERVGGTHPIKTDFRLIAATNVDLEKAVKDGRFREDLYYRLNVIPIRMPALRDRIEDLPELARFFLRTLQRQVPQERSGHRRLDAARSCRRTGGRATSASWRT